MTFSRRAALRAGAAACAAWVGAPARAQSFPAKPVRLIVPFSPGGNIDVTARALGPDLEAVLKQPVVVDNRPGAGGSIGVGAAAAAPADGYTLALAVPSIVTTLPLIQPTQYVMTDLTPVSLVSQTSVVLLVRGSDPRFKRLADLTEAARTQPGHLSAGHPSLGSPNHLALLQVEQGMQATFTVVPYKGSAPALVDLIGGQLDMYFDQLPSALPFVRSGQLRAIALCGREPDPMLPGILTVGQQGLPDIDATTYAGVFAPRRTPATTLLTLERAIATAASSPRMQSALRELGGMARACSQQEFQKLVQAESAVAQRLLEQGRLKKAV